MSFFDDYLKRVNQDGDNIKSRIITRREKKFQRYLDRSIYRSTSITKEDKTEFTGSLQPTKDSEKTCLYNLLTYKDIVLAPGELITDNGHTWLIIHKRLDETLGHNAYILMLLPDILTIEENEDRISFPARLTYDALEEIIDYYSIVSGTNRQYREPDRKLKVVCKNYDFLKKDLKFFIQGDTFKIEGINKTAISGCVYLTLGQCLTDAMRDDGRLDETDDSFWGV